MGRRRELRGLSGPQALYESLALFFWIVGICYGRADGDGANVPGEDFVEVGKVNAPNCHVGDAGEVFQGGADVLGAGARLVGLCGGLEGWSEGDVGWVQCYCSVQLVEVVGAEAEDQRFRLESAGFGQWEVVLAKMDAVGAGSDGYIDAVIDNAECVMIGACLNDGASEIEQTAVGDVFGSQLETIGTALGTEAGKFEDAGVRVLGGGGNQDVEADVVEATAGVVAEGDVLFEGICVKTQLFEGGGGLGVEDGGGFGKGAEGFS